MKTFGFQLEEIRSLKRGGYDTNATTRCKRRLKLFARRIGRAMDKQAVRADIKQAIADMDEEARIADVQHQLAIERDWDELDYFPLLDSPFGVTKVGVCHE